METESPYIRIDHIQHAIVYFYEEPIFGMGLTGFASSYGVYPHNIFIEFIVEVGDFYAIKKLLI